MQTNPADPAPRQALLKFLIDQKRLDEAFTLTEASLQVRSEGSQLLVDHGFLALQCSHEDEALADWNQAMTIDPKQIVAHLYLANELDREGKAQAAARTTTPI